MSDLLLNALAAYHGEWRACPTKERPPSPKRSRVITLEPEPQVEPPAVSRSGIKHPTTVIKEAVCAYYDITMIDLISDRKLRKLARPRQVAVYLCRQFTTLSFPAIGMRFGNRDHSTCLHACRMAEILIASDPVTKEAVDNLSDELRAKLEG